MDLCFAMYILFCTSRTQAVKTALFHLFLFLRYVAYWGGRNHYVFMGDSRIRQVYTSMVSLLSGKPYQAAAPHKDDHYRYDWPKWHLCVFYYKWCVSSFTFDFYINTPLGRWCYLSKHPFSRDERLNLHLEFLWQPMVNESMLNVYKKWIENGKKGLLEIYMTIYFIGFVKSSRFFQPSLFISLPMQGVKRSLTP